MADTITITVSSGDTLMERATTFAMAAHGRRRATAAYNIAKLMEAYAEADAKAKANAERAA